MNPYTLPVDHPDFQYRPSRNPYWKKLNQTQGVYLDQGTEALRGKWRDQFKEMGSSRLPLTVEIGCNGGHLLIALAEKHPNQLFIGIDWKFKQIYRGYLKAEKKNLKNVLFSRARAERLEYIFGPGEIDLLCIFFPDPWPKKSQNQKRFLNADWLNSITECIRPGGMVHVKTDHADYFDWIEKEFSKCADRWKTIEKTTDLHAETEHPEKLEIPDVTLFEKLFIKDKIPIKSLKISKKSE